MKVRVQLVVCTEEGQAETQYEVAVLEKDYQHIEQLGLTLAEAKHLLKQLQQHLVEHQAAAFVLRRSQCPACGLSFQIKERTTRTIRTLFGTLTLPNPRFYHCPCQPQQSTTFRPLPALLTASTTPELLFTETKWASLISYGLTARVLKNFLPIDETLNATTVQNHTLAVAQRCEEELEEELVVCEDRCPQDGSPSSRLEETIAVGLDGGYVRDWEQKQRHFEVIVGKSVPANQPAKCFGFVQTYDTNPTQRLRALLQSQGVQNTQPLTFLSDGGDTVRDLPLQLYPQAAHWIDWFHLTTRVTILGQYLKGMSRLNQEVGVIVQKTLESVKWLLWHGKVDNALDRLRDLDQHINHFADSYLRFPQLKSAVQKFRTYLENNRRFIPNYVISKRFVKRQSMQWTKRGAHLLLQMRVKTLNNELVSTFRRWHPDFQVEDTALAA
jgi:hypothetical protein